MNVKFISLLFPLLFFPFLPAGEEGKSVESAKDILKKALQARGGEVKEIKDLKIVLDFIEYREDGERFEGKLIQFYKEKAPGMTRREVRDCITGETTIESYDGKTGWCKKGEEVVVYKGREYYQDNKNLRKELEQFKVFLKVFFLEPFLEEEETLKLNKSVNPLETDCYHLSGKDERGVSWQLFIGKKDYHIKRVERHPEGGKLELYEFSGECQFKGIRFPQRIKLYVDKQLRFKAGLTKIDLNLGLKDEFFQPPKDQ